MSSFCAVISVMSVTSDVVSACFDFVVCLVIKIDLSEEWVCMTPYMHKPHDEQRKTNIWFSKHKVHIL